MDTVHALITERWSPVAFDSRPVSRDKIELLIDAARWAPSGNNGQPWRFIYSMAGTPEYTPMFDLLNRGNRVWAGTAPLLMISLAQVISTYKDRPNRLALYETGMAVANLLLQATYMGLFVHQMAGYDRKQAREVLELPERYEPAAMMAIGYKGDPGQLPPDEAERETRERKRLETAALLYRGKWGIRS
jgi:nitroreductase